LSEGLPLSQAALRFFASKGSPKIFSYFVEMNIDMQIALWFNFICLEVYYF